MRSRKKLFQRLKKCGDTPEKHPRIPEIAERSHVSLRQRQRRLLREAPHVKRADPQRARANSAAFNVTVTGFWPRGWNSHDNQVSWRLRQLDRCSNELSIALGFGYVAVGRQDGHHRIAALMCDVYRSETNGSRRVAAKRFSQNMRGWHSAHFSTHRSCLLHIC